MRLVHGGASLPAGVVAHGRLRRRRRPTVGPHGSPWRRGAAMVGPTDTIALDAGPTALALARALPVDFRGSVITHSMPVLRLLDERAVAGRRGRAGRGAAGRTARVRRAERPRPRSSSCARAPSSSRRPRSTSAGLYARTPAEASVQRRLIGIADRVVLVATARGVLQSAPARIAPLDRLTAWSAIGLHRGRSRRAPPGGRHRRHRGGRGRARRLSRSPADHTVRVRKLLNSTVDVRFAPHNVKIGTPSRIDPYHAPA